MRSSLFVLLLFVSFSAVAQESSAPAVPPSSNPAQDTSAQKAKKLLDQMIQAMGGQAYLNVHDMTQEGRSYSFYQGQANSVGTLFWRFWQYPDKDRVEFTKKRDVAIINVGDKGYEVTYKGTAWEDPDALADYNRRWHHSLETVLRGWMTQPDTALFYDGPAVAEQKACDSVTIMNAQNDSVTIFIDQNTHLPVKKTFNWRDPNDRLKNEEAEIFDNWRDEQGVLTPHTIWRARNGETTNQRFLTTVKYNTGIPDTMFHVSVTYDPYKNPKKK